MTVKRTPTAFGDQRGWLKALKDAGEVKEIEAEVDWNVELGTIMRLAQGEGDGPALLFKNIKDYNGNYREYQAQKKEEAKEQKKETNTSTKT